jgi:hypothetical protein
MQVQVQAPATTPSPRRVAATDLVSVLMLLVALAALWWRPLRVVACEPQAAGLARCTVAERVLGLLPVSARTIDGVAHAELATWTEASEVRDGRDRPRELRTPVEGLVLSAAGGAPLWRSSERHLIGASLGDVAGALQQLLAGETRGGFARWYVPWPVLLLASLFLLLSVSHLGTLVALALRRRGILSEPSYRLAYWLPSAVVVALLAVAWLVALAGAAPPRWLTGIG